MLLSLSLVRRRMLSRFFLHHKTAWLSSAYFFSFSSTSTHKGRCRHQMKTILVDSFTSLSFSPPFLVLLRPTCSMAYAVPSLFGFFNYCLLAYKFIFFSVFRILILIFFFRRFDSHFGIVFLHCSCAGISSSFFFFLCFFIS